MSAFRFPLPSRPMHALGPSREWMGHARRRCMAWAGADARIRGRNHPPHPGSQRGRSSEDQVAERTEEREDEEVEAEENLDDAEPTEEDLEDAAEPADAEAADVESIQEVLEKQEARDDED